MDEDVVGNIFDLAQGGDGAVQITGIPQDDRGDDEVQAGGAMLLVFVGTVANFPEPMARRAKTCSASPPPSV
jgi:hypothetical protein